ncbi:MAG: transcriptional regulator domain-containing protein [Sphingopyxis sp.]
MDQTIDWRSPYFPKIFEQYDRADFAQEFLRRNPSYRRQYAAARRGLQAPGAALGGVARHWGLVFRPGPRP